MIANSFTAAERDALGHAKRNGWLTLTAEIGDAALARWQQECRRSGRPFAVLRLEPARATLWFVLPAAQEWREEERAEICAVLAQATGAIITANSARAFVALGSAAEIMARLPAAHKRQVVPRSAA